MSIRPPNILLTIADDQRGPAVGCLGEEPVITPSMDRLASRGVAFRQAHHFGSCHGAVCAPSRFMLHAGVPYFNQDPDFLGNTYPKRAAGEVPITLGRQLRAAGYDTFASGKWHNGIEMFQHSFADARTVFFGGMADHWFTPVQDYDPQGRYPIDRFQLADGFSTEVFANSAIDFIRSRRGNDRPFFCYVAFTAPHDPRTPPDEWRRRYRPSDIRLPPNYQRQTPDPMWFEDGRDERLLGNPRNTDDVQRAVAEYYGMISHMDQWIGAIHDALEQERLLDNTLVIHTADHGLGVGQHGLLGKQNLNEHSIRVPLIMAGPSVPANVVSNAFVYQHDLHPTLLGRAGLDYTGRVFQPLDAVMAGTAGRDVIGTSYRHNLRTVRDRQWKLIRHRDGDHPAAYQLFDLEADPWECTNLADAAEHQGTLQRMIDLLEQWCRQVGDPQA